MLQLNIITSTDFIWSEINQPDTLKSLASHIFFSKDECSSLFLAAVIALLISNKFHFYKNI